MKSKITSFDSTYDYRLYTYLKEEVGEIEFKGAAEDLGKRIDQYITAQKDNNVYKQEDGLKNVWRTYTELLEVQEYNRTAEFTTKNPVTGNVSPKLTRLVPEKIADDFFKLYDTATEVDDPTYQKFNDEGEYHYYA